MEFNKMYQKVKYIVENMKKNIIFNYGKKTIGNRKVS